MSTKSKGYTIGEARLAAASRMKYLTQHLVSLTVVERPGLGTFAVDAYCRMYFDPECLNTWNIDECAAVILHEDLHVVLAHASRARKYLGKEFDEDKRMKWNYAADFVVNQVLRDASIKLPSGCLFPEQFKLPPNKTVEEYYVMLDDQHPDGLPGYKKVTVVVEGSGDGDGKDGTSGGMAPGEAYDGDGPKPGKGSGGSGADGQSRPWECDKPGGKGKGNDVPGLSEHEQKILERAVAKTMDEHHKNRGTLPAHLQRMVEEILRPKVDPVRELLAKVKFAVNAVPGFGNYTWKKLNRRQASGEVRMPAHVQPIPRVDVIVDTSGSMGKEDLGLALGVISSVLKNLPSNGVRVMTGDTHIQSTQKCFRPEQVTLCGGGGTDMSVLIEDAAKRKPKPDVILLVSDGETPWPAEDVGCRVVACLTRESEFYKPPAWIEVVEIRA